MNILFICHRLPYPPKRGGKIRPFNIIRHFSEQGHRVTVASLARSAEELEEGAGLRDYCKDLLVGNVGRLQAATQMLLRVPTMSPSTMGYFYSPDLHRLVSSKCADTQFDLVFVHCSSAAQYARYARSVPSILDFGDMDSQKWLDYTAFKAQPMATGYWLEGTKLAREEAKLARAFDVCTCTTRSEYDTLAKMDAASAHDWFPNGVDTEYFSSTTDNYDADSICFVGRMDYFPNQQAVFDLCRDILPLVRQRRPSATLTVVGAEPPRKIRALAATPGITVTGTVDDVRPHVRKSVATVAPLVIARGTQNKILESMAMGVPVVASDVAAGGVDAEPGRHLLTASDPAGYAAHLLRLMNEPDLRHRLAEDARRQVCSQHNWTASMRKLDGIVESLFDSRRATSASGVVDSRRVSNL